VVFQGSITRLSALAFATILRHPSCFYFFTASAIPNQAPEWGDSVLQRDICWLTDPAPPYASARSHNSISVSWPFVSFCGIAPPISIETVQYILEIAEGVEHKPGYFTQFVSDVAVDYKLVCAGPNIDSTTINGLRPARWYHLRLSIEYLGSRFTSDTQSIYTSKWSPSQPSIPRVQIIPVASSFDLQNDRPSRLDMLISWYSANHNGAKITSYQLQVQRFDSEGCVIESMEAKLKSAKKLAASRDKQNFESPDRDKRTNQWTQSHGRSALQIHNSLVLGKRSPSRNRSNECDSPGSPNLREHQNQNRRSSSHGRKLSSSQGSLPPLNDSLTSPERRFKWEIVYDSLLASVKCGSPSGDQSEWHLRVRARNSEGWSDFGPVLKINAQTHPSLFSLAPPVHAYGTYYYMERGVQNFLTGNEAEAYKQDLASQHKTQSQSPDRDRNQQRSNSNFNMDAKLDLNMDVQGAPDASAKPPTPRMHVLHFKTGDSWDSDAPVNFNSSGSLPRLTG
jgi:hypothetical protein